MAAADRADEQDRNRHETSLERYLLMNEKEKDIEIQKAVVRLQRRIQEILYLLDAEKGQIKNSDRKK